MAQQDIIGRIPRRGSTRPARIRLPSSPQRSDSSQLQEISPYDRDITDRAQQRGSTCAASVRYPSSPQRSDSSQPQERSSYHRTRTPSPVLYDMLTGTQMDRDIRVMKNHFTERPSKRKKASSPTKPGRGIRKIIDLFHDLPDLVAKADKHSSMSVLDPEEAEDVLRIDFIGFTEDQIEEELKDRKRCHTAMLLLEKLIPGFREKVNATVDINSLCALLQSGANDARADDTVRLRAAIADWLNCRKARNGEANSGPWLSAKDRDERGISNDVTGRLLCPVEHDWDNPGLRAKLRDAAPGYDFTSSYFIRCLYQGENGDPENPEEGFLMGPLLLRTYRHIFTSPSSASKDPENAANLNSESKRTSRRRDVATTLRLHGQVTPRSIAYAATQLVFSLSSAPEWKPEHAGFHYPSFYYFIVDYFEDSDNNDAVTRGRLNELLVWWNGQIFPDPDLESGGTISSHAKKLSQKRLQESRARRAHR